MIKKALSYIIPAIIFLFSWSCETDVDLNSEWQDIPVVYGLLNQQNEVHYIRINRAYLGEGNALKMASNPDSIQYDPDILEVNLLEYNGNNLIRKIPLDTTMIHNAEPGVFPYPDRIVYRTSEPTVKISANYTYRLEIYNKMRDKYIESETELIRSFYIKRPLAGQTFVNFTSSLPTEVIWRTAERGRLYQLTIRAFYTNYFDNGTTEQKTLDWNFPQKEASSLGGGGEMSSEVVGQQFYVFLKNSMPQLDNVERTMDSVQYIISVANDEFATYMKVNKPSNTIIQERPEYSNISNGIGLFASRFHQHRTLLLNSDSQDSLVDGSQTRHLNFVKPIP